MQLQFPTTYHLTGEYKMHVHLLCLPVSQRSVNTHKGKGEGVAGKRKEGYGRSVVVDKSEI